MRAKAAWLGGSQLDAQLHGCGSNAQQWFSQTKLSTYADSNGFILVYPSTPNQSNCWDVQNAASLTHGQGGDALGIISMVNYAVEKYSADKSRIYIMGFSSGGMMTNLMAGSYPEVFEAVAAYSGVAFGCFQGTSVSILRSEAEREAVVNNTDPCEMDGRSLTRLRLRSASARRFCCNVLPLQPVSNPQKWPRMTDHGRFDSQAPPARHR